MELAPDMALEVLEDQLTEEEDISDRITNDNQSMSIYCQIASFGCPNTLQRESVTVVTSIILFCSSFFSVEIYITT